MSECITYNHGRPLSLKGKLSQWHSKNLVLVSPLHVEVRPGSRRRVGEVIFSA